MVDRNNRPAVISPNVWIVAIVLLAIVVGVVAVLRTDRAGSGGTGLSDRFDYQIEQYKAIDPALIRYDQTHEIPAGMQEARAVDVGPEDRIYVAGDKAIHVFGSTGTRLATITLDGRPTCLAVGGAEHAFPGRAYVGVGRNVEVLDAEGRPAGTWEIPGKKAYPTSIAAATDDVFVADYANQVVLRYDVSGKVIGRIGRRDKERGIPGLVIPSPFFDVAVGPEGLVWVVNPGALRLEAYTFDGDLELFWGEAKAEVEGFFGCCNPAHFALLPDGRFVTAEKGLLRVKVYTADGGFDCVVAGPEQLDSPAGVGGRSRIDHEFKAVDVAADSHGRILVLDLAAGKVRIYEPRKPVSEENGKGRMRNDA
ncbi:MAG: hypothetical protein A2V98_16045 [Planctomycetes bacterium RBG_16_64_12]|nr:MAG: hypothetical protein A2V98_16045 [Planctomycetes bacterium RBG_16_64_12]